MISFELTEAQSMVQGVVRDLAKRELRERALATGSLAGLESR